MANQKTFEVSKDSARPDSCWTIARLRCSTRRVSSKCYLWLLSEERVILVVDVEVAKCIEKSPLVVAGGRK
jgi:hypothetical protein